MLRKLIDCIAGLIVTAFLFLALLGWADRAMGEDVHRMPPMRLYAICPTERRNVPIIPERGV